mgnify:CR=1 FL=1
MPPPGVGAEGTPVNVGLAMVAFVAKLFVIVVEKFASSFIAAASSFKVSNAPGAESTIASILACKSASCFCHSGIPETVSVIYETLLFVVPSEEKVKLFTFLSK